MNWSERHLRSTAEVQGHDASKESENSFFGIDGLLIFPLAERLVEALGENFLSVFRTRWCLWPRDA